MSDHLDMQYDINSYSPEAVGKMDRALAVACEHAASRMRVGEDVRQMLASGLFEGVRHGMRSTDELVAFSLRSIPVFRIADAQANPR